MNLEHYIKKRQEHKSTLLMTHLVVGYPSLEANYQMLEAMEQAGVDLVELQMPFSEPIADGPLFVHANQQALEQGVTFQKYLQFAKEVTQKYRFPALMMGYLNTAFQQGYHQFCKQLQDVGLAGFILADLPVEEGAELFQSCAEFELSPILICTPTNTTARLQEIVQQAKGFLYCVARKGVTGQKTDLDEETFLLLERCRERSSIPLGLGFGISSSEQVKALQGKADLLIVGSALLRAWQEGGLHQYQKQLQKLSVK